jgi:hypothetical protein
MLTDVTTLCASFLRTKTTNKIEKRAFLYQLGEWHVKSACPGEAGDDFDFRRREASRRRVAPQNPL